MHWKEAETKVLGCHNIYHHVNPTRTNIDELPIKWKWEMGITDRSKPESLFQIRTTSLQRQGQHQIGLFCLTSSTLYCPFCPFYKLTQMTWVVKRVHSYCKHQDWGPVDSRSMDDRQDETHGYSIFKVLVLSLSMVCSPPYAPSPT